MKSILITFVLFICSPQLTFATACPPPPTPLRQLVLQAELIAIGTIVSKTGSNFEYDDYPKIELELEQVLQGRSSQQSISLYYDPWTMITTGGASITGERLMVFVNYSEEKQMYFPTGYHTAYKMLDNLGMMEFRGRIKELQAINTINSDARRDLLTTDWLISCAENAYTYWDGAYELSPFSSYMRYYDAETEEYVPRIELSEAQKNRIRNIVMNSNQFEYYDVLLVDTISGWQDREIYTLVVSHLKSLDTENLWNQSFLLYRIAYGTNRNDLSNKLEEIQELEHNDDWQEQADAIALEFVRML